MDGVTPRMFSTKEKILNAAVKLFSEQGYGKVSMRDIARTVGINVASIYNHFKSKGAILKSLYEFYVQQQRLAAPTLESLLHLAETEPFRNVLMKFDYDYPIALRDTMVRILITAGHEICKDADSEQFIRDHVFGFTRSLMVPLLNRMIELDKIKPINVNDFVRLISHYAFAAAVLDQSDMKISLEDWRSGLEMIFSLLEINSP